VHRQQFFRNPSRSSNGVHETTSFHRIIDSPHATHHDARHP
jgi:hypothetical protein